jgi:hypothetical protein
MASSLFGGTPRPNPLQSAMQAVNMQNQINQLQLSQAMCGVVRYPNTFAYNAGPSPFCGNGCCGTANI